MGESYLSSVSYTHLIFMIDDDTSMACLTDEEKNRISHRAKALEKLVAELSKK